jgi:protein O-mannosyl-transferase
MTKSKKSNPKPNSFEKKLAEPTISGYTPSFFDNTGLQSVLFFLLAFLLYANTLSHGFVLDDFMVIKKNNFTQQGIAGIPGILHKDTFWGFFEAMDEDPKQLLVTGGRYRPLSLVLFALVWQFFKENAFVFHLLTVLLYASTGVLLYQLLRLLLSHRFGTESSNLVSWLATLIFICHPLHTEVVANIKGCDEILALLGSLATLFCALKAYDSGAKKWWFGSLAAFFLACLSKENAVTFLAIVPMAIWCFRTEQSAVFGKARLTLGLFTVFLIFFVLRGQALGWSFSNESPFEPMNNPFIKLQGETWIPFSPLEKLATISYTLGKYALLLFLPHPLTHDYYPRQIGILDFSNIWATASLLTYLALAIYGFNALRKRKIIGFGIIFYLITLSIVSNLPFSVGTLMNERFLYMPSVGFCLISAVLLMESRRFVGGNTSLALGLGALIALGFSAKTIQRNPDWASNEKLFLTDVKISGQSAKAHDDAGGVLFNQASVEKDSLRKMALLAEAIGHFDFALGIHPKYRHALMHRSASYHLKGDFTRSIEEYRSVLAIFPNDSKVTKALAVTLREHGRFLGDKKNNLPEASKALTEAWALNPADAKAAWLIGVSFAKQGRFSEAVEWFGKAVEMKPNDAAYIYDLGTAYFRGGLVAKGTECYAKAKAIDPEIGRKRGEK